MTTTPEDPDERLRARVAANLDQQEFMHSILPGLSGERCYIFGLLMYERLVAKAERAWPDGLPDRNTPYETVNAVLETLWARLPDEPAHPTLGFTTARWYSGDPVSGAMAGVLHHHTTRFSQLTIRWSAAAAAEALTLWQNMTSMVPSSLHPVEYAAQREDLVALRDQVELDIPALRARARKVGRELVA